MEHYKQILRNDFSKRQRKNSAFSLRAYSKYLGVASATLSEVMRDRRKMPQKYAEPIADKLNLSPIERSEFIKSIIIQKKCLKTLSQIKTKKTDHKILDEQRDYNIIAHWEYYAFLNLIETDDFINDDDFIAKRLNISSSRVRQVKGELEQNNYITIENNNIIRGINPLMTSKDVFSRALRNSHKESLEMAIDKIESVSVEKRFYSSSTVPVSIDKIDEAKELIREFREKMCLLLKEGKKEEVYNLNIQLYPLTQINTHGENNE